MVLKVLPLKRRATIYAPADRLHAASGAQQDSKVIASFDYLSDQFNSFSVFIINVAHKYHLSIFIIRKNFYFQSPS